MVGVFFALLLLLFSLCSMAVGVLSQNFLWGGQCLFSSLFDAPACSQLPLPGDPCGGDIQVVLGNWGCWLGKPPREVVRGGCRLGAAVM